MKLGGGSNKITRDRVSSVCTRFDGTRPKSWKIFLFSNIESTENQELSQKLFYISIRREDSVKIIFNKIRWKEALPSGLLWQRTTKFMEPTFRISWPAWHSCHPRCSKPLKKWHTFPVTKPKVKYFKETRFWGRTTWWLTVTGEALFRHPLPSVIMTHFTPREDMHNWAIVVCTSQHWHGFDSVHLHSNLHSWNCLYICSSWFLVLCTFLKAPRQTEIDLAEFLWTDTSVFSTQHNLILAQYSANRRCTGEIILKLADSGYVFLDEKQSLRTSLRSLLCCRVCWVTASMQTGFPVDLKCCHLFANVQPWTPAGTGCISSATLDFCHGWRSSPVPRGGWLRTCVFERRFVGTRVSGRSGLHNSPLQSLVSCSFFPWDTHCHPSAFRSQSGDSTDFHTAQKNCPPMKT